MDIYVGHSDIQIGSFKVKAFQHLNRNQFPQLIKAGLVSVDGDENVIMYIPVAQTDIINYPTNDQYDHDTGLGLNITTPHRYFHPPTTEGEAFMLRVPKARVCFHRLSSVGDPIHITWYFWTGYNQWRSMAPPNSSTPWQNAMNYVTELVETVEPIPESNWQLPRLAPLPSYFNTTAGAQRLNHLIRRAG